MSQKSNLLLWALSLVACLMLVVEPTSAAADSNSKRVKADRKSQNGVEARMKRDQFLGRLRIELRKNLCGEGGFPDCFSISQSSCAEFVSNQFVGCSKKIKTSSSVSLIGEDLVIAEDVSRCISENFSRKYKTKLKESNECKIRQNL